MKQSDKVLCINDIYTDEQKKLIPSRPIKNEIYTIVEILLTRNGKGIILEEINNSPVQHPSNLGTFIPSFALSRFRVIDPKEELILEKEDALYV